MATILYIHGFLSSPQSFKAQITQRWLKEHYPQVQFICPELSSYPAEAKAELESIMSSLAGEDVYAIGSSLGGYWSTYLAEKYAVRKVVLVNPAVAPHTRFNEFVGKPLPSYYSDKVYTLGEKDLSVLVDCDTPELKYPDKYWLMVQTEDETLDYRLAVEKYHQSKQLVEEGGSHTFDGYEKWLPEIIGFFGL